ncbi:MAG: ligase-associated DNA damage response exonuclease [Saprospiraceae bacterium]|nr:ligase-associated DNA damage response exonuclease [Saprospiraceae bacterium]
MELLSFKEKGIYCSVGDFFIDPWKPVKKALITHAHSDHARNGHEQYIAVRSSVPVMKYRLGSFINISGLEYAETLIINGVKVSFHPAGHVIGSAQIRVEYKGEVWVVSGDYKTEDDGISEAFEPVKCHSFVTESTFGLPSFRWKPQSEVYQEIHEWWIKNQKKDKVSIIGAYSLGKAQRLIHGLREYSDKILTHGAVGNINEILIKQGIDLPETKKADLTSKKDMLKGALIIAPPASLSSSWSKKFGDCEEAVVSGWMAIRGIRRRRSVERGFVLSDHADWDGLNEAIRLSGAENIYVTHGYTEIFSKWLNEGGYNARPVSTMYGENEEEDV